jgi:hypothetical protein
MSVDSGLRSLFRKNLPAFDWCTVETGVAGRGVPDANYCFEGQEGWIEFKKADHWRVTIRPEQIGWAERRIHHGGLVFCAIRQQMHSDTLWIYPGNSMRQLKDNRIDAAPWLLGTWPGGPSKWDWAAITLILQAK